MSTVIARCYLHLRWYFLLINKKRCGYIWTSFAIFWDIFTPLRFVYHFPLSPLATLKPHHKKEVDRLDFLFRHWKCPTWEWGRGHLWKWILALIAFVIKIAFYSFSFWKGGEFWFQFLAFLLDHQKRNCLWSSPMMTKIWI